MIHAMGAITLAQRRVDHIGGIQPAAEADLQQHRIRRMRANKIKR